MEDFFDLELFSNTSPWTIESNTLTKDGSEHSDTETVKSNKPDTPTLLKMSSVISMHTKVEDGLIAKEDKALMEENIHLNETLETKDKGIASTKFNSLASGNVSVLSNSNDIESSHFLDAISCSDNVDYPNKIAIEVHNISESQENLCQPVKQTLVSPYSVFKLPEEKNPDLTAAKDLGTKPPTSPDKLCQKTKAALSKLLVQPSSPAESVQIATSDAGTSSSTKGVTSISGETPSIKPLSCPNKFCQKPKTALVKKSIFSDSTSNDVTFECSKDNDAAVSGLMNVENLSTKLISSDQRKTTGLTKLLVQPSRFPASVKTKTILKSLSTIEVINSGLSTDAGKGTHGNHPLSVNLTETSGAVNITETSGIAINDQTTFASANLDVGPSLPSNCADSSGFLSIQISDKRLNLPVDTFTEHFVTPSISKVSLADCSKALNADSRQLYHSATQPDQQDSCYISLSSGNILTDSDMASEVEDGHCLKKSQVNHNLIMKENSNQQESVVDIESCTADYKTPEQIQLSKHKMLFSNTLHMILKKKPPVSRPLAVREIKCKNKDKTNQFISELQKSLEKRLPKPRENSKLIFKRDETVVSREEEKGANNMKSKDRTDNLSPLPEHLTSALQEESSSFKEAQLRLKKHFERKSPNHSNTVVPKNLMTLRSNVKELVKQELVYLASMSKPDTKKSEIPSTQTQAESPQQDEASLNPEDSSLINILQKISASDEALDQTAELIVQTALSDNGLSEAASSTSASSSWDSIVSAFLPVLKILDKAINGMVEELGKALAVELYGIQKQSTPSISNLASNHHLIQLLLESAAKTRQADVASSLPNLHLPEAPRRLPKDISDIWKRSLYKYIQLSEKSTAQLHMKDSEIQTTETFIVQENETATGNAQKQKCLLQGSASDQQEPSSLYHTIYEELTNDWRLPNREVKNSLMNTLHTSNKLMKQGSETSPFCAKDISESLTEFNSAFSCTAKSDTVYVSLNKSLQPEQNQNHEKVKKCQKESRVLAKIKFKRKLSKILRKKRPRSIQGDTTPRSAKHKILLTPAATMSSAHLHKSTAKVDLFVDSTKCPNPWDVHGNKGMHDIIRPRFETISLVQLTFPIEDETESIFDNTLSGESSACFEEDVKVSWSDCLATEQPHPKQDKSGLSLNNTSWSSAVKKVSESIKSCISDICLKHQKCHFHGVEPSGSQSQLVVPSNVRTQPNDLQEDPNTKDNNSSQPYLEPLAPAPNAKVSLSSSCPALSHSPSGNAVPKETIATAPIESTVATAPIESTVATESAGSDEVNCKEEREQSSEVSCSSENLITQINKGANKTCDASMVQNLPTREPNSALVSVASVSSKADSENFQSVNISSVLISSKKPPLSPRRLQAKPQTDSTNGKTTDGDCKLTTLPNALKEDSVSPTSVMEVPSASSDVSSTHGELFSAISNMSAPRKEMLNIDAHKETSNSYRDGNLPKDLINIPLPKDSISVPLPKDLISVPTDKTSKCINMPVASTETFKVPNDLPSRCTERSQTCMDGFSVPNECGSNRTYLEIANTSREVLNASREVFVASREMLNAPWEMAKPAIEVSGVWREGLSTHNEMPNANMEGNSAPREMHSAHQKMYNASQEVFRLPGDVLSVDKDITSAPGEMHSAHQKMYNVSQEVFRLPGDVLSVDKDITSAPGEMHSAHQKMYNASQEVFRLPGDVLSVDKDIISAPREMHSAHQKMYNASQEVFRLPGDVLSVDKDITSAPVEMHSAHQKMYNASQEVFRLPGDVLSVDKDITSAPREMHSAHQKMYNVSQEVFRLPGDVLSVDKDIISAPREMHSAQQKMYNASQEIFHLPGDVLSVNKDINSAPREGLNAPRDMSVKATEVPSAPKETFSAPKEAFRPPEVSSTPRVKPPMLLHLEQVKKLLKNIPSTNPDLRSQDVQKPDALYRALKESHTTTSPETSDVSEFFIPKKSSNPHASQLPAGAHLLRSPLHSTTSSKACTTSVLSSDVNTAVNDSVSQQGSSRLADASNSYGFSNQLSSVTASAQSSSFSKPLPYSKAHFNSKLKRAKSFKSKNIPSSSNKTLADESLRPQNTDLLESFPPVMPVTIQNLKEQHNSKLASAKEPHDSSPSSAESESVISDIDKHSSLSYELKDKKLKLTDRAFEMRPTKKVNRNTLQQTNPENPNGFLNQNKTDEIIDTNNFNSRPQQAPQDLKDNVKQPSKAKGLTMSQIKSLYTKNVPSHHLLDKAKPINSPDENKEDALVPKLNNNLPQPINTDISVFSPLPQQNLRQDSSKLISQSSISIQDSLVNSLTMREMNSDSTSDKESSSPLASDTDLSPAESSIANPVTTDTDLTSTYSMANFVSIHSDQKKGFESNPSAHSACPAPKTKHEFFIPIKGLAPNQQQPSDVTHQSHLFKTLSSEFDEKRHNASSHTFVNLYAPLTKPNTAEMHQAGERRPLNENQYFLHNPSVYPPSPQYQRDHAKEAKPIRQGRASLLPVQNYDSSGQSSSNHQHPIPSNQFHSRHNQQSQLYTASSRLLQQNELLDDHIYQQQQDYHHLQADFNRMQQEYNPTQGPPQEYNHVRDEQEYNRAQGPQEYQHARKQDEYDNYCNHQPNYNQSWQSCSCCTHNFNGKPSWQFK